MPRTIDRHEVQELIASGAQLVDVRDRDDYERGHIVGAIALPLKELTREAASRVLEVSRPTITYCHDYE